MTAFLVGAALGIALVLTAAALLTRPARRYRTTPGYHRPSWCRTHHRPHIHWRRLCLTNTEREHLRRVLTGSAS